MSNFQDDISELIHKVATTYQKQCGQTASESLIAFIIRAVVLEHPDNFNLAKELADPDIRLLVKVRIHSMHCFYIISTP